MDRRCALGASIAALLALGLATTYTFSQQSSLEERLVGTWTLVSIYDEDERAEDVEPFGSDPQGQLVLDSHGHFSFQIFGPAVKFASNDRKLGTALENGIAMQGSLAYFGTYSVDSSKVELTLHVKVCLFPNWNGTDRRASLTVNDSRLDLTSAAEPSFSGSYYSHSVWKRVE
jgi:hypothetical protein